MSGELLTDLEERYGHLLKPIRDLAKNWDIDIASHLEEYLEEIDKIEITFDGGASKMNFSQAAMLVQGSACVYGRKVEHLYSMVMQVLDLLANKKLQQKSSKEGEEGNENSEDFEKSTATVFLCLEDIDEHIRSDMKTADLADRHLLSVEPLAFDTLQGFVSAERIVHSNKGDILGHISDFHLNGPFSCESGHSIFDPSLLPLLFLESSVNVVEHENYALNEYADDVPAVDPCHEITALEQSLHSPEKPCEDIEHFDHYESNVEIPEDAPIENVVIDGDAIVQQNHDKNPLKPAVQKVVVDVWDTEDPYAASKDNPCKRGRTYIIPKQLQEKKSRKRKQVPDSKNIEPINTYCAKMFHSLPSHHFPSNSLKIPTFSELELLYYKECKHRSKIKELFKKKLVYQERIQDVDVEDDAGAAASQNDALDVVDHMQEEGSDHEDAIHEIPNISLNFGDMHSNVGLALSAANMNESHIIPNSYEDMVKQYVNGYLDGAQRSAHLTGLAKRVAEWEEKILPTLKEEETHEAFDIHKYGTVVLNAFEDKHKKTSNLPVPFKKVVHANKDKCEPYQVCRLFLATLQLANNYNLEISSDGALEKGMDTMKVRFLSERRHHEQFKEYQAPSLVQQNGLQETSNNVL